MSNLRKNSLTGGALLASMLLLCCSNMAYGQPVSTAGTQTGSSGWDDLYAGTMGGANQSAPNTERPAYPPAVSRQPTDAKVLQDWFARYDQVRRAAQMNPKERARADALLSKGLSIVIPGDEKIATRKLLTSLVARYDQAIDGMKRLPLLPETTALQRGYYQYFLEARALFGDYLKVQDNLFAKDPTGTPIAASLMPRKQRLESIDGGNKVLDGRLRATYGVAAYQY